MKISFLQGVTMAHPEDSILLISHFDSDGAMLLHQTIGKCQRSCRLEGGTTNETGKRKEALDS